jgi:transcriptional regulator with XRE-family HTH domain
MTIFTSTGRRRELGAELRHIREGRGYNGIDMAERLKWTSTMLSRAETGKRTMNTIEVATYTGLCGVTGEEQDKLLGLLAESDDYRLKAHPGQIPDALRTLMFYESTANVIESVQPLNIPGITQTPEYARALFEEGGWFDPATIEDCVSIRMSRREVLTRVDPALCTFYVHEYALRTMVGGPQVMHEQMLQMLFASSRPQCVIRVIPASAGSRGLTASAFQVFHYPEGPPVVYVQNETTCEFLENGEDLSAYQAVLNRVASVALNDAQSRSTIASMASQYEQLGVTEDEDSAGGPPGLAQE